MVPIEYMYQTNPLKGYIRKGWAKHYKNKGLTNHKAIKHIAAKMHKGKIPPHLRGKEVTIINKDGNTKRVVVLGVSKTVFDL